MKLCKKKRLQHQPQPPCECNDRRVCRSRGRPNWMTDFVPRGGGRSGRSLDRDSAVSEVMWCLAQHAGSQGGGLLVGRRMPGAAPLRPTTRMATPYTCTVRSRNRCRLPPGGEAQLAHTVRTVLMVTDLHSQKARTLATVQMNGASRMRPRHAADSQDKPWQSAQLPTPSQPA